MLRLGCLAVASFTFLQQVTAQDPPPPPGNRPDYLRPVIDPKSATKITRITGDPGELIPGLDARWDTVARHGYSKEAVWNADQSLLLLRTHHGFPSMLFLNGRPTNLHLEGERGDQTQVYTLTGERVGKPWLDYGRPSHYDLAIDGNGDDIAVGVSKSKPDDGRVIKRRLSDGKITVLTAGGYASHTSTRNLDRPVGAYVAESRSEKSPPP